MDYVKRYAEDIAKTALEIGAIKLNTENPFQWASGYHMPIYNDNRMLLHDPDNRGHAVHGLQTIVVEEKLHPDIIAGVATGGIAWAAELSRNFSLNFIYIRDKPKGHGLKNQIEGIDADKDLEGKSVVVIEDLISTGGSSARAVQAVRDANGVVTHCISIFNYGLDKAINAFDGLKEPCEVRSLLTYDVLLEVARKEEYLTDEQVKLLEEWRADPFGWGEKHGFPKVER